MHMGSQLFASKMAGNWWLINCETTNEFYASMTTTVKSSSPSTAFTLCKFATLQVHCVKLKRNCRVLDLHMNNTMVTNWWRYWWGQCFLNLGFCKRNFHSFKLHTQAALCTPKIVTINWLICDQIDKNLLPLTFSLPKEKKNMPRSLKYFFSVYSVELIF